MLEQIYYNNTLKNWLISGGIILAAMVINWIITFINSRYLRALAKRTKTPIDNIIVNSLETPLKVGVVLISIWIAFGRLEMSETFDKTLSNIYEILTVLNITWFVSHLVNGLLHEYFIKKSQQDESFRQRFHIDSHSTSLVKKIITYFIWIIGVVTALTNAGLDLKAILGTLGIGGIALALAAQDTVKNIFGGFTILMDGTFRIGDRIIIGQHEGHVESIGIRSTKIRNFEKRLITIPNYKIVEDAVTNVTAAPQMRVITNLSIVYHSTPQEMNKALDILKEIALANDKIDKESVAAFFIDFGDYALNIRLIYFVKNPAETFNTSSEVNLEILKKFDEHGIQFAYPSQTLYFDKDTEIKI